MNPKLAKTWSMIKGKHKALDKTSLKNQALLCVCILKMKQNINVLFFILGVVHFEPIIVTMLTLVTCQLKIRACVYQRLSLKLHVFFLNSFICVGPHVKLEC